jgi:hypothetical protein
MGSTGGGGVSAYLMEIKSEQYVTLVVQAAITLAMKTSLDPELTELRQAITTGKSVLSKSLDNNRRMLSYDHNVMGFKRPWLCLVSSHRNPKKIGCLGWVWVETPKPKPKLKTPKTPKKFGCPKFFFCVFLW